MNYPEPHGLFLTATCRKSIDVLSVQLWETHSTHGTVSFSFVRWNTAFLLPQRRGEASRLAGTITPLEERIASRVAREQLLFAQQLANIFNCVAAFPCYGQRSRHLELDGVMPIIQTL